MLITMERSLFPMILEIFIESISRTLDERDFRKTFLNLVNISRLILINLHRCQNYTKTVLFIDENIQ